MKSFVRWSFVLILIGLWVYTDGYDRFKKPSPETEKKLVEKEIGYGKLVGNTYTNDYFNLKVTIPKEWHISSSAEKEELEEVAKDFSTQDLDSPQMKAARARVVNMLSAFRYKPDIESIGKSNYQLAMFAENIRRQRFILKNEENYLKAMKRQMSATTLNYTFQTIQSGFKIGSIPASRMKASMMVEGIAVSQVIYCAIVRDYAFVVSITYRKPEELKMLEAVISTIEASH